MKHFEFAKNGKGRDEHVRATAEKFERPSELDTID